MAYLLPKSIDEIDLIEQYWQAKAREDFWAFRQYMHPKMKIGWWQREISQELTNFYYEFTAGKRPILLIQAPPQHGKSYQIIDFIAWMSGKNPDVKTIYASFSERLGVRANLALQRMYDSAKYKGVFPDTRISERNSVTISGQKLRNREILEYLDYEGYFRNTTVRGSITGEGLDLGILDDPIKGREEASSINTRDKTWDWLTDDFMSRFSEYAGLLGIMTRWHIDDPFGRIITNMGDKATVRRYPAIAEKDEKHRKQGEALFPEHKSLEFLMERKEAMFSANWEALYQQNPVIVGGGMIKTEWFGEYSVLPKLKFSVVIGDTAQKIKERNDFSVFEHWGLGEDGYLYLIDLIRGKWEADELKKRAIAFWIKCKQHGNCRYMGIEDKSSGTGLIQQIRKESKIRIPVKAIERNTDKYTRFMDAQPYIESGYVKLPREAVWLNDFLAECERLTPDFKGFDDQIDPMMDAIDTLLDRKRTSILDAL